MNKAVFVYYPAKRILNIAPWSCTYQAPLGACNSTMTSRVLTSIQETERSFGSSPAQCGEKATLTVGSTSLGYSLFHSSTLSSITVLMSTVLVVLVY
jgi:hypothetical protein